MVFCAVALVLACSPPGSDGPEAAGAAGAGSNSEATFVGGRTCVPCHPRQAELWTGSHHDQAMQVADADSVLGDFGEKVVDHFGARTRFFRRDAAYWVEALGPDGIPHEYQIAYTFGVDPLQQYLILFPDGRYQALDVAWDSRPADRGGQRWFHLRPGERSEPGSPLHWTGVAYTWNYMCADCHSTGFEKSYDLESDTYDSSYAEVDVACEACHGPASPHLEWAAENATAGGAGGEVVDRAPVGSAGDTGPSADATGLLVGFESIAGVAWPIDPETGLATRVPERTERAEIETCGRCHARRSVLDDNYGFGRPITDFYRVALLEEGLYHADGQILDEVFVFGSFLQSKMYQEGVTCSDCHEPHSLRLNNLGNALCSRCHLAEKFDAAEHHHHEVGTEAASCVACHMPATTYMVVDPRRDHSMRVPRPDLSVRFGMPNACGTCHTDHDAQWAANAVVEWYGAERAPHFSEVLATARRRAGGSEQALLELVADAGAPGIARATALSLLRAAGPVAIATIEESLANGDPLIRSAALTALDSADPTTMMRLALPMIRDSSRTVRLEAARSLAALPAAQIPAAERAAVARAIDDYRAAQLLNADRAQAHLNLGWLAIQEGDHAGAEDAYLTALRLEPMFVPTYANLADLYRITGRDGEAEPLLRRALEIAPASADVHYALGLLLVREERLDEAIEELRRATRVSSDQPHYIYVYAVAVQTAGRVEEALEILKRGLLEHPEDRELLFGAAAFSRESGDLDAAIGYARRLVDLSPSDRQAGALLRELEALR